MGKHLNPRTDPVHGATDGRLLSITGDFVGSTGTYTYAYESNSNSDLIDTVSGPVHTVDNQWETTRDALDWKENKVGTATVSKYDYSVNAIGQRDAVAATSTVGTFGSAAPNWNWGYNVRGELISSEHVNTTASSRHYTFDGIGNRTEHRDGTHTSSGGVPKAYTPNALNQYDAVGTLSPVHDLDGNMTSGPLPAVPGANSALVWDGNNQLIEVTPSGGSAVQYHYDAIGRRIARTVGSTRTYWFYDGWNVVAEFSGAVHTSGTAPAVTLEKTWLWGTDLSGTLQGAGGVGGLLAVNLETGGSAGVYHPLYDGNGNIAQYLNSSGVAVAKYEYDGFGNSLVSAGTHAALFPHRFSTKPMDSETGLYYYLYRYYDPATGRWPSRDPINERGGVNLYEFVLNAAISRIDFLGLEKMDLKYSILKEGESEFLENVVHLGTARIVHTIEELLGNATREVGDYSPDGEGECNCIKDLTIYAHSGNGTLQLSPTIVIDSNMYDQLDTYHNKAMNPNNPVADRYSGMHAELESIIDSLEDLNNLICSDGRATFYL